MQHSIPEVLSIGDDRSDEDMPLCLLKLEGLFQAVVGNVPVWLPDGTGLMLRKQD